MPKRLPLLLLLFLSIIGKSNAQSGELRGFIYNSGTGVPVGFFNVFLLETKQGSATDENGFYSITKIKPGKYTVICSSIGFDSLITTIEIKSGRISKKDFFVKENAYDFDEVKVTAERRKKQSQVTIGEISVTPKQLRQIPTVGGEPDLVQYLQVLPGVVFSGDQGGQLYIRGGSPVMNMVLLDGMTIYNPFHSIGLFSVFDADIIKSADVYSAGFGSEYGGRISAIVDVKTREGNKKHKTGKISTNPFTSKLLLEGPLKKFEEGKGSSSYIVSYKNSYLDRSSKLFYNYIGADKLPYSFSDFYGKMSINAAAGSRANVFAFSFKDKVAFPKTTSYDWASNGFGANFLLVPDGTKTIIDGMFAYSSYKINQTEPDLKPRSSGINGFNLGLNFTYFLAKDELKYGLQLNGFKTEFQIYNSADRFIDQYENTTDISGFIRYKKIVKEKLILEMGFRIQHYASLNNTSPEPRLRVKYNMNRRLRLKAASGLYSQNLISAISDRDVVNLFYGFLSGPDDLPEKLGNKNIIHRMQTSRHAVAGVEYDLNALTELNLEFYIKDFTQLTNINRDKIFDDTEANQDKPMYLRKDFIVEKGVAKGFDVTYKYSGKKLYIWTVYSFNIVERNDGIRKYQPHFDRRHNVNVVASYGFGKTLDKQRIWEVNGRWNLGSGFPFTLTQGFYENIDFASGSTTDYTKTNGDLAISYADLNTGRLPYYHRLDFSVRRMFVFKNKKSDINRKMEIIASVTNVYNRENIFYFDRVKYQRVNQLPILPSLSASYTF
jgi:hypothetical protein